MAKTKIQYRCSHCGNVVPKWQGKCDNCNEWNTFEEVVVESTKSGVRESNSSSKKPIRLREVQCSEDERIITSMDEFNRVMGKGVVFDSVNILTAPPGSGKSTLLLQIGNDIAKKGYIVLYVSGEESVKQVRLRANRICGEEISDNFWIISETCVNRVEEFIKEKRPAFCIWDSIQCLYCEEIQSRQGTPSQINESASRIIRMAKNPDSPSCHFLVAQMTKQDELRGDRTLEHMVDAVLYLEKNEEVGGTLRILRAGKNRFGDTEDGVGLFLMQSEGLVELTNPFEYFVTKRDEAVSGSALTVTKEGNRNIVIEIQSLAIRALYGYPQRTSVSIKKDLLQMLTAILEVVGGISVSDKDILVNVVGGLKLTETAVNLGILMSIVSSVWKKPIPMDTVFIGEVGLTGELATVPGIEARIKEVDRLGFKKLYIPKGSIKNIPVLKKLEVIEPHTLQEVIKSVFGMVKKRSIEDE